MKAVILAGGIRSGHEMPGSQLPRALWPLPSEPVICGVIEFLLAQGITDIAICANGKTRLIENALQQMNKPWMDRLHFSEDAFPRGPGGCLKDLAQWIGGETFAVIQGTGSYAFDLAAMRAQHDATGAAITVGAMPSAAAKVGTLQPAGVFLMQPAVLEHISAVGYQDIKEQVIPRVRAAGSRVMCHRIQGTVQLIHGPEHYLESLPQAIAMAAEHAGEMRNIDGQTWAHPTAKIDPSARCIGPVWIERDAVIDANAVIVGPAIIGRKAHVATKALVSRAVLMPGSLVSAGAELSDTLVAPGGRVNPDVHAKRAAMHASESVNALFGRGASEMSVMEKARKAFGIFRASRSAARI